MILTKTSSATCISTCKCHPSENTGCSTDATTPTGPQWSLIAAMANVGARWSWRTATSTEPSSYPVSGSSSTLGAEPFMDLSLDYLPRLPKRKDFRIGCIGAGFIMRDCHLLAYRQAGFNPVAIASRRAEHAREVAQAFSVPRVHVDYGDLLADKSIEVLDIAVPP